MRSPCCRSTAARGAYNTTDQLTGGLLGFADDNWSHGTQSYVFAFLSPLLFHHRSPALDLVPCAHYRRWKPRVRPADRDRLHH